MNRKLTLIIIAIFVIVPLLLPRGLASADTAPATGTASSVPSALGNQHDGEVVSLRDRTSRTYAAIGHMRKVITLGSQNFRDAAGTWLAIDNSLSAVGGASNAGYAVVNRSNRYSVRFPSDIGRTPISISSGNNWLTLAPIAATGQGTISGASDAFTLSGATETFTAGPDGIKDSISLAGPSSSNIYTYLLNLAPGLTARTNSSGSIDVIDSSGTSVFSLSAPFMTDAAGAVSHTVTLGLTPGPLGYTITETADAAWLADPARQYPVVIDPTVTIPTNSTNWCYIAGPPQNSYNFCAAPLPNSLPIGWANGSGVGASYNRALLQFSVSSIPTNSNILDANLSVYGEAYGASQVAAYPLTQSFDGGTVTWDDFKYVNYVGSPWTTPGGDYSSTSLGTQSAITRTYYTQMQWTVNSLVQGWVNGTTPNDGVLLKEPTESGTGDVGIVSPQFTEHGQQPALIVDYAPAMGVAGYYPLVGGSLDDHISLSVDAANLNLVLHAQDLSMPHLGAPLSISRTYNSLSTAQSALGNGWTFDGTLSLQLFADKTIVFTDASGYLGRFDYAGINPSTGLPIWSAPGGMDATLTQVTVNGNYGHTITYNRSRLAYTFDSAGRLLSEVDRNGNQLQTGLTDTMTGSLITQISDPAGRVYTYAYTNNNLTSYTDPANKVTQFTYDTNNLLTQITDPNGNITQIAYNGDRSVASITRITDTVHMTGYTTTFTPAKGQVTIKDPAGHTTTIATDIYGREVQNTDPVGNLTQVGWTADNHVQQVTSPSQNTSTVYYDDKNNPIQTVRPNGATTSCAYANASFPYQPSSCTDAQRNTTTFGYDSVGRVTTVTDGANHTSTTAYNTNGTPSKITDANGNQTVYSYDSQGRVTLIQHLDANGAATSRGNQSFTYTSGNLVATSLDGKGQQASYSYDATGRPTGVSYYADAGTNLFGSVGATYDADGNVLSQSDPTAVGWITAYSYDALNRTTQQTVTDAHMNTVQQLTFGYNSLSQLTSQADTFGGVSAGTTQYGYDSDGRLAYLIDPQNNGYNFSYTADGQQSKIAFPGGITENFTYNSNDQLTQVQALNRYSTVLMSRSYGTTKSVTTTPYCPVPGAPWCPPPQTKTINTDLWTSMTDENSNTTSYTFDGANRLTNAVQKTSGGTQLASDTYAYDPTGNMTSENLNGTTTTMGYNAVNELTSYKGTSCCGYDANGNMTTSQNASLASFNPMNQTASMTPSGGSAISYQYSGAGQNGLINEQSSSQTTAFRRDSTGMANINDSKNGITGVTRAPGGQLLSEMVSGTRHYYLVREQTGCCAM